MIKSDFSYYTKFIRNYILRIISPTKPDLKNRIIDFLLFKKIIRCYKNKPLKKTHTRCANFCFHPRKSFAKILIRNVYIIKIYAFIYFFQVGRWKKPPFFPDSISKVDIVTDVVPFPFFPAAKISRSGLSWKPF